MGTHAICKRAAEGGVWSADPAPRTWTSSPPFFPGPASGRRPLHPGRHPRSTPPTTAHPFRPGRRPEGRSNLGPEGDGEQEVPILQQSKSQPPGQARSGTRPEEPRERAGVATPHPGPAPEVHAGRARRLLGTSRGPAIPPGPDRDSTPRASRSDGSPSGDVARAPPALRATPRS